MKKAFVILLIIVSLYSCKKQIQYNYVEGYKDNIHKTVIFDTIAFMSENDTTAYKEALKRYYLKENETRSKDTSLILFNLLDKNKKMVMKQDETLEDINFKDSISSVVLKEINITLPKVRQ